MWYGRPAKDVASNPGTNCARRTLFLFSAVTETTPEPETTVFFVGTGELKPRYFWS